MANTRSFSVTDEQLNTLSEKSKNELFQHIDIVGQDADVTSYFQKLSNRDVAQDLAPEKRTAAIENQTRMNVDAGMPVQEARRKAFEDVREVERKARAVTTKGETTTQPEDGNKKIIREGSIPAAIAATVRPQVVRVETPLTDEEKKNREDVRSKFLAEPTERASREADDKGLSGVEKIRFIADRQSELRKQSVDSLFQELFITMKNDFAEKRGIEVGMYDPLPEEYSKQQRSIIEMASQETDKFIRDVFPDELEMFGKERTGFVGNIKDWRKEGNIVTRQIAKGLVKGGAFTKGLFRNFDEETGTVSESYLGATSRVLFELLSARAITYPIMKSLTWDRNPNTGLPYDPEDPRYKFQDKVDKELDAIFEVAYAHTQGRATDKELERAQARIPSAMGRKLFVSGTNVEPHMNTGSDFRDYLLSVANMESTIQDVGRLHNVRHMPNWYSPAMGLLVELSSPWEMTPLAIGSSAIRGITLAGSKGAQAVASGMKADSVADFFKNAERWADSEQSLVETLAARKSYKNAMESIGKPVTKSDIRAVEGYEDFAGKMAPSIAAGVSTLRIAEDPLKATAFAGIPKGSAFAKTIRTIAQKRDQMLMALEKPNWAKAMKETPVGRELYVHINEAAKMMPKASFKAIGQQAVISIAKTELAGLLQNAMPSGWLRVSQGMVVRRAAFVANQDKIMSVAKKLSATQKPRKIRGKYYYKYVNPRKSYTAAIAGAGAEAFSEGGDELFKKILLNKPLDTAEYLRAQSYIQSAAVESVLGKIGKAPIKGLNITEKVYGKAAKEAINRNIPIIDGTKDFFRGARMAVTGKSPIIRNMYPTSGGGKLINFDLKNFNKKIDPEVHSTFNQLTNKLNELPRQIDQVLVSGDTNAADEMLRVVAGDDPVKAYEEMVNLFFNPAETESLSGLFGPGIRGGSRITRELAAAVKSGRLPKVPNLDGMRGAIEVVYEATGGGELLDILKERAVKIPKLGVVYGTNKDNIGMLWAAYIISKKAAPLYDEAFDTLNKFSNGIFIRLPDKASKGGFAYRASVLRPILLSNGIDPKLADELVDAFKKSVRSTFSATDQRTIGKSIIEYIASNGFLPGAMQRGQMYQVINNSVIKTIGAGDGALSKWGRLDDVIKKAFPDDPTKAKATRDVVANAWVKALTDIDTDRIYSLFNQQGILTNASKADDLGGARNVAPTFVDMRGTDLSVLGPSMADNLTQYSKFDKFSKANEHLSRFRPADRAGMMIVGDGITWTRKMTINGLLAGWGPFMGLRYMSQNVITGPLITAVSAPAHMLTTIATVPTAMAGSVMRGMRRSGFIKTSDAYDPATLELVGGARGGGLVAPNGTVWTEEAIEIAARKQNIRYSRSTYDFQVDLMRETMRAGRVGPNGKPVWEMDVFGGKYVGKIGEFWDWFRPDRKTFFSVMAEEADNIQREAVFRNALRVGSDEQAAGLLARNSMLDYGNLPRWAKKASSKWLAFFAFRYRMTADFLQAALRGGKGARNISRTGRLIQANYEDMQEWVLTPDYLKSRLWINHGDEFKQFIVNQYGVGAPWAEGLVLLGNIHELFLNTERGTMDKAAAMAMSIGDQLDPRIQSAIEIYQESEKLTGTNFAPKGFVPSAFAISAKSIPGGWGFAKKWYGLVPVPKDKERPDLPLIDGRQWKFGPRGKRRFAFGNLLQLSLGMKRGPDDLTRALARMGIKAEGIEFRKDEEGTPIGFLVGETSSSIINNPEYIAAFKNKFLYYSYESMARRP